MKHILFPNCLKAKFKRERVAERSKSSVACICGNAVVIFFIIGFLYFLHKQEETQDNF